MQAVDTLDQQSRARAKACMGAIYQFAFVFLLSAGILLKSGLHDA